MTISTGSNPQAEVTNIFLTNVIHSGWPTPLLSTAKFSSDANMPVVARPEGTYLSQRITWRPHLSIFQTLWQSAAAKNRARFLTNVRFKASTNAGWLLRVVHFDQIE
jgi:hypothetical protein